MYNIFFFVLRKLIRVWSLFYDDFRCFQIFTIIALGQNLFIHFSLPVNHNEDNLSFFFFSPSFKTDLYHISWHLQQARGNFRRFERMSNAERIKLKKKKKPNRGWEGKSVYYACCPLSAGFQKQKRKNEKKSKRKKARRVEWHGLCRETWCRSKLQKNTIECVRVCREEWTDVETPTKKGSSYSYPYWKWHWEDSESVSPTEKPSH